MEKEYCGLKEVKFIEPASNGKKMPEEYWPTNGTLDKKFAKCYKENACHNWM